MSQSFPKQRHVYQNHTIDSTRWDGFVPREDNIVIATPYKCGTTWMQHIVVSRDVRDVFMSLWNHYSGYTEKAYDDVNHTPGRVGDPQPVCPDDIRVFWKMWISKGWFEWESEGYPF